MSTRATYSFTSDKDALEPLTTIYIHYDGYPEGAATYFWNLLKATNKRGNQATRFIRANENAELTSSHENHADTEYRYYVSGDFLTAQSREYNSEWLMFFNGNWHDFVNEYAPDGHATDFEPIKKVKVGYGQAWLSQSMLEEMICLKRTAVENYRKNFPTLTGNLRGMESELVTLLSSLEAFDTKPETVKEIYAQ